MYNYAVRFEADDAPGLAVFCRDLPELNSYGEDEDHAMAESVDAIVTTLSLYADQRRLIPPATPAEPGERVVNLPAVTVAKIVLWNTMMERNMRKADLCRLLKVAQVQGDRLVDFMHTSKMEQLEAALVKLGVGIRLEPLDPRAVRTLFYPSFNKQGQRSILIRRPDVSFNDLPEALREAFEGIPPQESEVNLEDFSSRWWLCKQSAENLKSKGWDAFVMAPMSYQSKP